MAYKRIDASGYTEADNLLCWIRVQFIFPLGSMDMYKKQRELYAARSIPLDFIP